MGHELKRINPTRRYVRVRGPFDGYNLGLPQTSVLVYDLNLGGGFVNFGDEQPSEWTLQLKIDLPQEGPIMVNAETVYRHQFGVAVRFVDMDADTAARLLRTVDAFSSQQAPSQAAEPFKTNLTRCH